MRPPSPKHLEKAHAWVKRKYGVQNQPQAALQYLDESLREVESYRETFRRTRLSLLFALERWRDLAKSLEQMLAETPRDPELFLNLAELLAVHGRWTEALSHSRRALRLAKKSGSAAQTGLSQSQLLEEAYDQVIRFLVALNKKPEAIRTARRALQAHPRCSDLRLALRSLESGTFPEQIAEAPKNAAYLRRFLRLQPSSTAGSKNQDGNIR